MQKGIGSDKAFFVVWFPRILLFVEDVKMAQKMEEYASSILPHQDDDKGRE